MVATVSDDLPLLTPPPGAPRTTLAGVVNLVTEKLGAALMHTSHAKELDARRKIAHVLGRKLEPLFALELVTLLLVDGKEGNELRAAFTELLSMTQSEQWAASMMRCPAALVTSSDEAKFIASDEAAAVQHLARCGECMARTSSECEEESLTSDEAARLQWAICAQCRCGTSEWYQR